MSHLTGSAARLGLLLVAVAMGCTAPPAPAAPHLEPLHSKLKFSEIGVDEVEDGFAALVEQTRQEAAAELDSAASGANLVFSPWSRTRTEQIVAVARDGGDTSANRSVAAAIGQLDEWQGDPSAAPPDAAARVPVLRSQTMVVVDRSLRVAPEFLGVLAEDFDMGVYLARPEDPQLQAAVNDWADRTAMTRFAGLPAKLLGPSAVYTADVTALVAEWKTPFDPARTVLADFQTGEGKHELVPTMRAELGARTAAGARWRAAELPLADRLVLRVIVPNDPRSAPGDILPAAGSALDRAPAGPTSLTLPRWSTRSDLQAPSPGAGQDKLASLASGARLQGGTSHAAIAVAEQGVAVDTAEPPDVPSELPGTPAAQPAAFAVDRAFCFEVLDGGTGLVVLAGRVEDPTR